MCQGTLKEFKVAADGCPISITLEVHFLSNDYAVSDTLMDDIKSFAQFLKENSDYKVLIKGYTDSSGDKYKNKILSQNRANSVKEALVRYGIDKNRLISIGKGSLNPIADNATVEGRIRNRRIEVELIK
jgi:OOP family OmpA-OmpF porin